MFGSICPCGVEGLAWLDKQEIFVLSDSTYIYEHAGHHDSADFFRVHHDHAGEGPRWLEDEDKGDEDEEDEDDEDKDGKDEDTLAAEQAELEHAWEAPRPAIDDLDDAVPASSDSDDDQPMEEAACPRVPIANS